MKCSDFRQDISAFLDQELKEYRKQHLHAHMDSCRACRQEFQRMKEERQWWKSLSGETSPSRDLWPQIEQGIRLHTRSSREKSWTNRLHDFFFPDFALSWSRSMATAGILGGLLLCLYAGSIFYHPSSYDDPIVQTMMKDYIQWRQRQLETLRSSHGNTTNVRELKTSNPFHVPVSPTEKANPFIIG